jgi:heat shock transcription factor
MSTRKRNATGTSQAPPQSFPHDAASEQYMHWNDPSIGTDMSAFNDPSLYEAYGGNSMGGGHNRVVSLDSINDDINSGQLVRRNPNHQLAPAPRRGQWDPFQSPTQQWDTVDDDEELEHKAAAAKKDAQAKRKQIPPFVQKLSRLE